MWTDKNQIRMLQLSLQEESIIPWDKLQVTTDPALSILSTD